MMAIEQPNGNSQEITLVGSLNDETGGLQWDCDSAVDAPVVRHIRTKRWMLPMLNDHTRNEMYMNAIQEATASLKTVSEPVVLDIGTGTGLLAMQAAKCSPNAQVVACEMAAPMARLAERIIASNNLSNQIKVVPTSSSELELQGRADLCVSELLDYGLLGEGILPTLRDAWQRLLKPGALMIPSQAKLYAQVLTGGAVAQFSQSPDDNHEMKLPVESEPGCIPVHAAPLLAQAKTLTGPHEVLQLDFRSESAMPDPAGGSSVSRMNAVTDGVAQGVLIWWDLEIGTGKWYSSLHEDWQDHWQQGLCLLPATAQIELIPGEEIELVVLQHDESVSFDLRKVGKRAKPNTEPKVPKCMLPPHRVRQLHDSARLDVLYAGIAHALATKGAAASCLDIADAPIAALLALRAGATRVSSLESGPPRVIDLVGQLCLANHVTDPSVFRVVNVAKEQLTAELLLGGSAQIVLCEPYFEQMDTWHLHEAINMYYTHRWLRNQGLVAPDALAVPSSVKVFGCAVQLGRCASAYEPVSQVCGFDHSLFANAATMHDHDLNLQLWQYGYKPLSEAFELSSFCLSQASIGVTDAQTKFTAEGSCDALVIWVEYGVLHEQAELPQVISTSMSHQPHQYVGRGSSHHQYVRFLQNPFAVGVEDLGNATISCKTVIGPQSNGEDYSFEIQCSNDQ